MPSRSQAQHDFMVICCKDKDFADKNGINQEVACEFVEADKKAGKWQKEKSEQKKKKPRIKRGGSSKW